MKGEIAVARRTTYRVEENVQKLEKEQKKADLLIDHMNEENKRLNELKTLYTAQLISQKEETAAATNTIKEAQEEIDNIDKSTKQLKADWDKSINGMRQRDDALQQIKDLIKQKNDDIMEEESKINGIKNETKRAQQMAEDLSFKLRKCQIVHEAQTQKKMELIAKLKLLEEEKRMLDQSLNMTNEEMDKMNKLRDEVEKNHQKLEEAIMTLHKKTKEKRDDIINHASSSKTTEKSTANLLKQTKMSYENISKKEVQIEGLVNEISRVKIDNMNSEDQNRKLQEKLNELVEELKQKQED